MSIYDYEGAFGGEDKTTTAMKNAVQEWFSLYYDSTATAQSDPCQRIAYTVVNKLVKTMFGEYQAEGTTPFMQQIVSELDALRHRAVQLMLVGGECYLKPCVEENGFSFTLIPRDNLLIFARDRRGVPTDVGTAEQSISGKYYYTLLERRTVDTEGYLTIENKLYRSLNTQSIGSEVALAEHPQYASLSEHYRYETPIGGTGLVLLKTPMLNCVDGSVDGVSVYAPAVGLIRNIDENEAQLTGEFSKGKSRILASADLLDKASGLQDELFVGLDDDPEQVGLTIFSPQLREASFLARKQEYLRNVESVIGLKRGLLSDANVEDRTATEITSSAGDFNLTVIDFQRVWTQALHDCAKLCAMLAAVYGMSTAKEGEIFVDWGNGVLYDEDKTWADYMAMTAAGLIAPEVALGWRFNMPFQTPEERQAIREKYQ